MLTATVVIAGAGTHVLSHAPLPLGWTLFLAAVTMFAAARRGLYREPVSIRTLDHAWDIALAAASGGLILLSVIAVGLADANPQVALGTAATAVVLLPAGRFGLYSTWLRRRREGKTLRPTVVVGAGRVGLIVAERLLQRPELGLKPVGFLDKAPLAQGHPRLPVLGASWDLARIVEEHGVEQVVICFSQAPNDVMLRLVDRCRELGVDVALVPRLFEKTSTRAEVDHLGGIPLVHMRPIDTRSASFTCKYAIDRVVAAIALVVLSPVLAVAAIAVRRSLGSPVLFRQERVGMDEKTFELLKFRSMHVTDEHVPEHERLTRLGAFLRRSSIDELPQLINVLRGDMSLIGPRPERPELAYRFAENVHRYDERHRVKSGITGWAQVHGLGRGGNRFANESMRDRAEWDNFYIENWSLGLDLKIAIMTILAVIRFKQA
jgi:exopolysaccharide biosynthesis polyprenyl glycosylphosphotransferase